MRGQLQPFLPCFITLTMIQCFHWQQPTGNNCPAMRTKATACPWIDGSQSRCCRDGSHPQMLTKVFTSKSHIYNTQNCTVDPFVYLFGPQVCVGWLNQHSDETLRIPVSDCNVLSTPSSVLQGYWFNVTARLSLDFTHPTSMGWSSWLWVLIVVHWY